MATFSELCADVYTLTNRPDLVAETKLAVRQATLKMHHLDHFPKDIFETGIQFSTAELIQSLDYKSLVPRWRSFKYLRKYDNGEAGVFITLLDPEATLDRYAINKENICYIAGEQLEIRSNTESQYYLLGCYLHPDITEATYRSWIADEHPFAIVFEAAATVMKTIGFDEQAAMMKQQVAEQVQLLKQQVTGAGY
jgi:hypothetical protein